MAFFHGVKTLYIPDAPASVTGIPTAVIGVVGSAPKGPRDVPTLISNEVDAANIFGSRVSGFTLGYAFDAIFDHGNGLIVAVNVFNPASVVTVSGATYPLGANDTITLPHKYVSSVVVKNQAATTTYVENTDYTVNLETGVITRKAGGAIAALATLTVGYNRPDPSTVIGTNIIGGVSGAGTRTGLQALIDTFAKYGFDPTLIICPGYSELTSVSTEMIIVAEKLRGMALIDAPVGATRDEAISGRNGTAPVANFNTSSPRAVLCFPRFKVYDVVTGVDVLEPMSQRAAGVIAQTDAELGYWWSPSNKEVKGITGVERLLYTSYTDPNSDSNLLGGAGITSYLQTFGGGIRLWGNRSAAYPTVTTPENFIPIQRTRDYLAKSIERASLQYLDRPITQGLIDSIIATVLGFLAQEENKGALLPGSKCLFLSADNPPSSIQQGIVIFTISVMPPPPAEQITFKQKIDTSLLAQLGASK